jgi:hypothetical protein
MGWSGTDISDGLTLMQVCRCVIGEVLPLLRSVNLVQSIFKLVNVYLPLLTEHQSHSNDIFETSMVSHFTHTIAKAIEFHGRSLVRDPHLSYLIDLALRIVEILPATPAVSRFKPTCSTQFLCEPPASPRVGAAIATPNTPSSVRGRPAYY